MRTWLLLCWLIPSLLFVAAGWYDRAAIVQGAEQRLLSTADALAAHADTVLQTADLALSLELDAVKGMDWTTIGNSEEVHSFLARLNDQLPQIDSAFFVDPDGYNSNSSRAFPMPRYDVRDREYFVAARNGNFGTVISAPFHGRAQGDFGFTVSRARITDGKFDGLAAVTMPTSYFGDLYRTVLQWPDNSSALLLRSDGTVLAQYPDSSSMPRRLTSTTDTMRAAAAHDDVLYEPTSAVDHRAKIASIRWLPGRDVMVVAAIDRSRLMQSWYLHLALFALSALLAALALSVTASTALRHAARERINLQSLIAETRRRQEAEAALQQARKMDALGRLTGGVAHDFNNLLAAILGSLELAMRRVSDPAVTRMLSIASAAAERGAKLTAQMLAFARKQTVAQQTVDGNDMLRDMDELLRRSVGPLVKVHYQLETIVWQLLTDRVQLELAIMNLMGNARDAMPRGGDVTISTRNVSADEAATCSLAPREYVAFSVADTGEGMSETVRASAFEPFFTTKPPGQGTGLGLSMVYGFAQHAGGSASIDSAPGKGTTVTIYLPRADCVVSTKPIDAEEPVGPLTLDVLLVDDDAAVREPTAAMLREIGCQVSDVASGSAGMELLQSGAEFDVLVLDFAMPEMNGAEVARSVKALRPSLPIVFLTGYADAVLLEPLQALDVQVVTKPFRLARLAAALRLAVRGTVRAAAESC